MPQRAPGNLTEDAGVGCWVPQKMAGQRMDHFFFGLSLNSSIFLRVMFFCPAFLMVSTGWNPQNGSQNVRSSQNEAAVKPPDDGWPCSQKMEVEVFMDVSFWMFSQWILSQ